MNQWEGDARVKADVATCATNGSATRFLDFGGGVGVTAGAATHRSAHLTSSSVAHRCRVSRLEAGSGQPASWDPDLAGPCVPQRVNRKQ